MNFKSAGNGDDDDDDDEHIKRKRYLKTDKREDFLNLVKMYFFGIAVISYCIICFVLSINQNMWF